MRGYQNVIRVNQIPKQELPAQVSQHAQPSGYCGALGSSTISRVRDRLEHVESQKRDTPVPVSESETARLMRAYAAANAQSAADEAASREEFVQRAAERTRANQQEAKRQIIKLLRDSDALLIGQEVMALARELGHEFNPSAYPALIAAVRRKNA